MSPAACTSGVRHINTRAQVPRSMRAKSRRPPPSPSPERTQGTDKAANKAVHFRINDNLGTRLDMTRIRGDHDKSSDEVPDSGFSDAFFDPKSSSTCGNRPRRLCDDDDDDLIFKFDEHELIDEEPETQPVFDYGSKPYIRFPDELPPAIRRRHSTPILSSNVPSPDIAMPTKATRPVHWGPFERPGYPIPGWYGLNTPPLPT